MNIRKIIQRLGFRNPQTKMDTTPSVTAPAVPESREEALSEQEYLLVLMENAYERLYLPYQDTASGLTPENYTQQAREIPGRLLEMGIILHDLLAFVHGDIILEAQQRNLDAIKDARKLSGNQPDANPLRTPLEVMALRDALQKLNITDFKFLLNGYELHKD